MEGPLTRRKTPVHSWLFTGLLRFWKGFIVGYYPSELIPLGCAALLGFILLSRLKRNVQMREKLEQQRLDSEKGIE